MTLWRTIGVLVLVGVIGLVAFETISPTITDKQARDAAHSVANAAGKKILDEACPAVGATSATGAVGATGPGATTTTTPPLSTTRVCNTSSTFPSITQHARAAAEQQAKQDHVRLVSFTIDQPVPVVHVTISKQARSIILVHTPWRHYDDVSASAAARPT